ncbi:hypothetical protein DAEQUDRAFT_293038 [Daedalea quercina L-15889]|uniref:REJ domain-containing protein n=1 Tax=Daedalea quercina L-15889 TaxID=1314783 RepID=A0A165TZE9_9APHY|nr:hypothetical protein DAEQUDRAFT_293038 [Daedalea quercina L-15889]
MLHTYSCSPRFEDGQGISQSSSSSQAQTSSTQTSSSQASSQSTTSESSSSSTGATANSSTSEPGTTSSSISPSSGLSSNQPTTSSSSTGTQKSDPAPGATSSSSISVGNTPLPGDIATGTSHANVGAITGAAVGGSIALLALLIIAILYARRKKRAAATITPNVLRKSEYDRPVVDISNNDDYTSPSSKPSTCVTKLRVGNVPRRSRPFVVIPDSRAIRCRTLPSPVVQSANSDVSTANLLGTLSAAGSTSTEVDARSTMRQTVRQSSGDYLRDGERTDTPSAHGHGDQSSEGQAHRARALRALEGEGTSSSGKASSTWQTQLQTLRQEMAQEIARLREQTEAIAMVPPPAYV